PTAVANTPNPKFKEERHRGAGEWSRVTENTAL
ncbi:MAG: hypothetical protein ACI8PG_003686, partial [Planctomycetota bacterium]